ncbi:adenosine deaminase [Saccharophagus sp. K07]|uniref:CRISPR-associated ring nuclease n=1 Tax=Saccharophagus sp. K07 TaxID=2283636 RepID=UPI00165252B3|nr:CRISPR-associated ring nuclease [Saccharophagus sp. K07]MBC6907368.1 adenosine deaminase [Saccharophagus sp. K07]
MTTLIATLGATWQVIPEIVGLVLPDACPIYKDHPQQEQLEDLRRLCGQPQAVDTELWVITSSSLRTQDGIKKIREWNSRLPSPLAITFFIAADTDEVTSESELKALQELVLRVMLQATERGEVICSLAGGRKTMSADLQYAASVFGARALLHIVAPEPLPEPLRSNDPEFWSRPLSKDLSGQLLPAFIGHYERRETLDIDPPFLSKQYPLGKTQDGDCVTVTITDNALASQLIERERQAGQLLSNYLTTVANAEKHENWRHLYRLPPNDIERLRKIRVSAQHEALIRSLPKAELHCHLGGLPDLDQQIAIGTAVWQTLAEERRNYLLDELKPLLSAEEWPWDWPQQYLRNQVDPLQKAERAACLLTQARRHQLQYNLYESYGSRIQLAEHKHGFSAYERPGELTGSSILGHPAAIAAYCQAIHAYTARENIVYLELRGSPHKYQPENPLEWLANFYRVLIETSPGNCEYRFIWILDRRQKNIDEIVNLAVAARQAPQLEDFVVGLDLAGDEKQTQPEELAPAFKPAFAQCLTLTIHAGEGQPADNIWQAAYHLHADRIGHGLTLAEKPELLTRFRNRNICLELCPTSNIEVIGYRHPAISETQYLKSYPISTLWNSGVPLTINTDNPGISRTNLTREYLVAAELWEGMTLWDCLAIIKQGFVHAMAPAEIRESLLKNQDVRVYSIIENWLLSAPQLPTHIPDHLST